MATKSLYQTRWATILYRVEKRNWECGRRCSLPSTQPCSFMPCYMVSPVGRIHYNHEAQELLAKLSLNSGHFSNFSLANGVTRYKGRIWLTRNDILQQQVIKAMHDSAIRGHSGVLVTYRCLKHLFHWSGMKAVVHSYVLTCSICQQDKPNHASYPRLLQPLVVRPQAWHTISLDFIVGLPRSA